MIDGPLEASDFMIDGPLETLDFMIDTAFGWKKHALLLKIINLG